MSTEGLFGNFTFTTLRNVLKEKGVQDKDMSAALNEIAEKNNIDDIRNLDGNERIKIDGSIFNFTQGVDNPYASNDNDVLKSVDKDFEEAMFSPGKNGENITLPEIYNDDDYEVVDYDDYYSFGGADTETDTDNSNNNKDDKKRLNFNDFKERYEEANKDEAGTTINYKKLKEMFDKIDKNSDSYLDKKEIKDAKVSFLTQKKDKEDTNPMEGEDLLGANMMEMDMSGNAFNPQ